MPVIRARISKLWPRGMQGSAIGSVEEFREKQCENKSLGLEYKTFAFTQGYCSALLYELKSDNIGTLSLENRSSSYWLGTLKKDLKQCYQIKLSL